MIKNNEYLNSCHYLESIKVCFNVYYNNEKEMLNIITKDSPKIKDL